ncbi:hypothetical protein NQ318_012541 [Aromia moschata]|uniref:Transposase n=1 Tax=Aromia moschata TaxID=1265417 RepID=A0AAV8XE73_9CUCU|nr:hypothetical protein NQ318_012541 [Aromia moschata]
MKIKPKEENCEDRNCENLHQRDKADVSLGALGGRLLERQVRLSKSTINRVLTEQLICPFHIQTVQELLPHDLAARLQFSHIIQQYRADDMDFHKKILFTDESCFTRRGIANLHNQHVYADENPHAIRAKSFQREFNINVWMGFITNSLIGRISLPNRLDGNSYLDFLQNTLPDLFDDIPLNLRNQMYFTAKVMQCAQIWSLYPENQWYNKENRKIDEAKDEAPAHKSRLIRTFLEHNFPQRWISPQMDSNLVNVVAMKWEHRFLCQSIYLRTAQNVIKSGYERER